MRVLLFLRGWGLLAVMVGQGMGRITIEFGTSKRRLRQQQRKAAASESSSSSSSSSGSVSDKWEGPDGVVASPPPFVTRGWLWKKGHIRHNWKRRYFVLSDDWSELSYYERVSSADETPAGKQLGRVVLGGCVASVGLDYVPKRAHVFSFTLRTNDDVYYCEAATEDERQRWVRTLNTAGAARRGVDEVLLRQSNESETFKRRPDRKGLPTLLAPECVDAMIDDVVAHHRERAMERTNRVLNAEATLRKINAALRGAYVVESFDLRLLDPIAGVAVRAAKLEPSPRRTSGGGRCVRLVVEFDWPQRLECRVRGARPAGGGLPSFLRALSRNVIGRHEISFSLASRLARSSALALDLVSSREAPWPVLRHVSIQKLPRVELDRDALDVDDDRGLVGVVLSFVPKEVIAGLLENAINDALDRPGAPNLAWDVGLRRQTHRADPRHLGWLSSATVRGQEVSASTVDALRSVAAIAASAARTAARDSALAAAKVQAAAESLRAAVLDTAEPPYHSSLADDLLLDDFDELLDDIDDDDDDDIDDDEFADARRLQPPTTVVVPEEEDDDDGPPAHAAAGGVKQQQQQQRDEEDDAPEEDGASHPPALPSAE